MDHDEDSGEDAGPKVPPLELARSYAGYLTRALKRRKWAALAVTASLLVVTGLVVLAWPRTFTCITVLSAVDNRVLDGDRNVDALRGAEELIKNRENMAKIVEKVDLTRRWDETMPPASRVKQRIRTWFFGAMSEADKREALVSMVQKSITVIPPGWGQNKLTVIADWNHPEIAADLADAVDQSFLSARQVAEISTISEYIDILEGHATELRSEIQKLASQDREKRNERIADLKGPVAEENPSPRSPGYRAPPARKAPAEDLTELRAEIEKKSRMLQELEDSRQRRLAEAEATLTGLRSKFTSAHPMVATAEDNVRSLRQEPPQIGALKSDLNALNTALKSKLAAEELVAQGGPRVVSVPHSAGVSGASTVEPLPAEILQLMQEGNEELDPAVAAQFRGAVAKYATLRDKIGTARLDLDTAQAAFKHRYQIVVPAEVPPKPSRPKVPLILAAGALASLFFGLVAAVLAELRTGRVVERWQVYRLGVPLLGELRWPPTDET